ncbi:MAG: bifunctional precorrin-2 dehydrogenase/sirohydrochlorin ferrochelatase [Deltaproteobacteria bacterium]|nr:bifunctional precorrin-2 dehydrogenase/sirohydrochlorin ferrochelatase [Deltaproteobacteria bacterium]PIU79431.1 MAG: hypothetical protein COS73_04150 [Nitrospirae bacterium CG06_land_8_20_14_3_00_70_43]
MASLYPAMLRLQGRPVLVVGAGTIAASKVSALLEAGARVTVVAPEVGPELAERGRRGEVAVRREEVAAHHLDGVWLVVGASGVEAVDRWLAAECDQRRIFLNAVDRPPACTFYVPSVVRAEPILVAISTNGTSPALAGRLRRIVADALPPRVGDLARLLGSFRGEAKARLGSQAERHRLFTSLLDGPLPDLVAAGRIEEARALVARALDDAAGAAR